MQLLKFASNAVNRTPLPENGFRICACKTTTTYAARGTREGRGGSGDASVQRDGVLRDRWWWCRALIIPQHAIAIRKLPNRPRVWLGRQWCSIIRFACRVPYIYARTCTYTRPISCPKPRYIHPKRTSLEQSKSWYVADI